MRELRDHLRRDNNKITYKIQEKIRFIETPSISCLISNIQFDFTFYCKCIKLETHSLLQINIKSGVKPEKARWPIETSSSIYNNRFMRQVFFQVSRRRSNHCCPNPIKNNRKTFITPLSNINLIVTAFLHVQLYCMSSIPPSHLPSVSSD